MLISNSRSLDMLMMVRTSASHHSPTMGISQKKHKEKIVAEIASHRRRVSMEQRRCSGTALKTNIEELFDAKCRHDSSK